MQIARNWRWWIPVAAGAILAAGCLSGRNQTAGASGDSPVEEYVIAAGEGWRIDRGTARRFGARIEAPTNGQSFVRAAVKQGTEPARLGPKPDRPHFAVRFALPIPPDNDLDRNGALTGMDPYVWPHNHSPGLEVLPNGDLLAIYFSALSPRGSNESAPSSRFIQARLRHGAVEWDPPELFFDSREFNDQSALLWTDNDTVWFFGGGRDISPFLPFKIATSRDNGVTWTFSLPVLNQPATNYTPQPIVNAFRDSKGAIYFAMDAEDNESFLWRSTDNGVHWSDTGGRTGGRHSTIVPLGDTGRLLSIGGKNTSINGYTPQNVSTDWGKTWSESKPAAFSALGGNQRPSLIRLASGNLCYVTDSYHRNRQQAPEGWTHGNGCFVAISKDEGATWRIKRLPVELPHEADRKNGTLGYATVRQAPNGLIHVLATMTHPCLHYEFNEAWVFSDAGEIAPETEGGRVERFSETYRNGRPRVTWSARICENGRYLLEGTQTAFYENGRKQHEVTYVAGRKTGEETFWARDGSRIWSWNHQPGENRSTWTHYWKNGKPRIESEWVTRARARDVDHQFIGLVAHGETRHFDENGNLIKGYRFENGQLRSDVSGE